MQEYKIQSLLQRLNSFTLYLIVAKTEKGAHSSLFYNKFLPNSWFFSRTWTACFSVLINAGQPRFSKKTSFVVQMQQIILLSIPEVFIDGILFFHPHTP